MANILKASKRGKYLPRVHNGCISTSERYADFGERDLDNLPPMMNTLDVFAGNGSERTEYQIQLTEDEALRVAGEWLTQIARRRAQNAARARKKVGVTPADHDSFMAKVHS